MPYTTFAQAKKWVEAPYGDCDPEKTGRLVNFIRRDFYSWYTNLSLFLDAVECFRLQRFCVDCNSCSDSYLGITLPRDFQTVEAMWWNDYPMALRSEWKEFQVGISPECDCRLQKIDVPGFFPTALDLDPRRPARLAVRAFDRADIGKRFMVRGTAGGGHPTEHEFKLTDKVQYSAGTFATISRQGGVVKDRTEGRVVLSDEHGRLLSMIEPDETVPSYRRIKITGVPSNCDVVNVRASRRYYPLFGDDDCVETDNERAFDAMARYFRMYERADKTAASMAAEKDHYATAVAIMTGDKARETGKGTAADLQIKTPSFGGHFGARLNRTGGRRW